jgi:hypothetical protein
MNHPRRQKLPAPWHIISPAISIYRNNFSLFLKLAIQCSGWFFISNLILFFGGAIVLVGFFTTFVAAYSSGITQWWQSPGIMIIVTLVLLYLYIFAAAKGSLNKALMGLVAYQSLTGESESLQVNFRQLKHRMWRFWLLEISINSSISIMAQITDRLESGWIFLGIALQIFVATQYFVSDIILAVEHCNVFPAMQRSSKFSKSHLLPMSAVLIITWTILIPPYLLTFIPVIAVWQSEWQTPELAHFLGNPIWHLLQALGLSIFLFTIVQTLTIPLWQLTKASLYRELRTLNTSIAMNHA